MAKWNINFHQLPSKQHLDSQLAMLFRASAAADILADFIRDNYFPLAYLFAAQQLPHKRSDRLADDAADLATGVMEDIITRARGGTLTLHGGAAFSTYLYSAISNTLKAARRIYYPSAVKRLGYPAMRAYAMLLVDGLEAGEVRRYLSREEHLEPSRVEEIITLVASFREQERQRQNRRSGGYPHASLDALREGDEATGRRGGYEPATTLPGPEEEFLQEQEIRALRKAMEALDEPAGTILRGYLLDGRWKTISGMEAELGLKNGSYELKKAKEQLRQLLAR